MNVELKLERAAQEASGCVEFIKLFKEYGLDYTYWRERAINVLAEAMNCGQTADVGDPKREIELRARIKQLYATLSAEVRDSARQNRKQ